MPVRRPVHALREGVTATVGSPLPERQRSPELRKVDMTTSIMAVALATVVGLAFCPSLRAQPQTSARAPAPLKEAKLNIEHNATDRDTGFQGAIDGEGWKELTVTGPNGKILEFEGLGSLRRLGLTELFFETVEPENRDVPIPELLRVLPAGRYRIAGPTVDGTVTAGTAWLTHVIPRGPVLLAPPEGATVPAGELLMRWRPVTQTITGAPVRIISYQLIVEKVEDPHPHMIGKRGLSMYLPPTVTEIWLPTGFLERDTDYAWEVLAIEPSGNQTLSSSEFATR
jgi:hypothetical protein